MQIQTSKDMIRCGQLAQPARPRRRLFVAVRSAAWTVQIGRAAVIFRKNPSTFRKSTRDPESLSGYFARNSSDFFEINPQSRTDALRVFCKKTLTFSKNRPVLHKPSHRFLRKPPRIFLKSTYSPTLIIPFFPIQSNFDYTFFSKKNVWPMHRAHGRARKTSSI